jgi:prepilin-type N-terminal cleavage/methylation domain-containing protein/prepilin-type processing-associated H-X9-DG protein
MTQRNVSNRINRLQPPASVSHNSGSAISRPTPRLNSRSFRGRFFPEMPCGFTLVELFVVLAIIGILASLLLPAVAAVREQSRRVDCVSRLRQQSLGLHQFHSVHGRFPFGNEAPTTRKQSWCSAILPHIEQNSLFENWDRQAAWDDIRSNRAHAATVLSIFRCPSSVEEYPGDTDYAAIIGSALADAGSIVGFEINNGVLIRSTTRRRSPVSIAEIFDGTSETIFVAEVVDRLPEEHGLWADGGNAISHDNGGINISGSGEIFSRHPAGAQIAMVDGAVRFLSQTVELRVIGALCSRDGGEIAMHQIP